METAAGPLAMVGVGLVGLGGLIAGIFGILLMIEAFKVSVLWGLAYLFIPFASLVFIVKYWDLAKRPFLMSLIGFVPMMLGFVLMTVGASST